MKKFMSAIISLALALSSAGALVIPAEAAVPSHDVLRGIFSGIDDIAPDEKALDLPYLDGTVLSDVREPLFMADRASKILGEGSFASDSVSWKSTELFKLAEGTVSINGTGYSIGSTFKLLNAAEGDLAGSGKKSELAFLAAAMTTDGKSLLLLCTASASAIDGIITPIAVLYSGTEDFYNETDEFINCMEIVCADINGDGYDEIITATPTSGYAAQSSDKYKLDRFSGAYVWTLKADGRNAQSWKTAGGWQQKPSSLNTGMNTSYGDNCYLGAPGTTAAIAAGDVDGDGYDDLVTAFSTTKAQYNASYSDNLFSVYYICGAPTIDEMIFKRNALMKYIDSETQKKLTLGVSSGSAAGFDAAISDVDGSGKPTIFVSFKETVHHWAAMSGTRMYTPSYYIYSFDMKNDFSNFTASQVYNGGIYHHGWMAGSANDKLGYVNRTDPIDCAPVRIGVLKGDYGISEGKTGYSSSFTIIADQRLLSFVRRPDGNAYSYSERSNNGLFTYTDFPENTADQNGHGFANNECVFYRNGIYVTDIKTANIGFDGTSYTDAALITAYYAADRLANTFTAVKTYCLTASGNGYSAEELTADLPTDLQHGAFVRCCASAMPDSDDDSIYLKYNKHVFFWADPVIIAALASPPYFDSLPSDMYTNSQTTYGKSVAASTGKTESYTVSAGSYISTEIKGGSSGVSAVFETESEAMKSSSSGSEETAEVSYTQSFSASGGSDTVVLSTVAYDAYAYTAYYPGADGKTTESPYIVYVPRGGAGAIKIASLNYDDYKSFSKYAEGALPDLDDVFTHTVGKPETYPKDAPSGTSVLNGSILVHKNLGGFPSDFSSQTRSIEITNETFETTSAGTSLSAKLGGGIDTEAEDVFGFIDYGSKISVRHSTAKEYESGRISTKAVGTSFEGTVFGQGDGIDADGGKTRAYFDWKLLHYIYNFKDGDSVRQFPVITYIVPNVTQPAGVVPSVLTVSPAAKTIEQVGPATKGYVNSTTFNAQIEGVSREAYTALEGAPLGMSLDTGGTNIGSSGSYPFGIKINSNVKPGKYELRLNVGGVLSNPFTVTVKEYTDRVWIEADTSELDFGSMRYNYAKGTPSAEAMTVTVSNIHTEPIDNLTAELDGGDDSDFVITEELSSQYLYAKDLANSTATVKIAPKQGLGIGTHTGTLKVSNGVTAAFVPLKYTVTAPTIPQAPSFGSLYQITNPVAVSVKAPADDGGGKMLYYSYTVKDHPSYMENGEQIWRKYHSTVQSGSEFTLTIPEELTEGEKYTIGVRAHTDAGESEAVWAEIEIYKSANPPAAVENVAVYPYNGTITVTWDPITYWGENEYHPVIYGRDYAVNWRKVGDSTTFQQGIDYDKETEYTITGLENGAQYEVSVDSRAWNLRTTGETIVVVPSEEIIAPSRPTAFKAEMSYKKAELSWKAPNCTGGAEITGYRVSKDGGESWVDLPADTLSHVFDKLTTNSEYDFRVCAVNAKGAGGSAAAVKTAPSNLAAPSEETLEIDKGYEQVELAWEPIPDSSVTGYEAKLDDGEWYKIEPISFSGKLHYIFTGLENDREYAFCIRGINGEGGGAALLQRRSPSSLAPLPPLNPRVEARNGGIAFYGEKHNTSDILEYMVDGGTWWSFNGYSRLNGYENGKEYTVAIATSGKDRYGLPLRSRVYLTVTPDASVPDAPSEPNVSAYISDEYIRFEWEVENDGGAPIEYYEVAVNDDDPIRLPSTEKTFSISRSAIEEDDVYFSVTAFNSAGSNQNSVYAQLNTKLSGSGTVILPSVRSENAESPYKLIRTYHSRDDDGNPVTWEDDCSDYAQWSISSESDKITWNAENGSIVIDKALADGVYSVSLTASLYGSVYEKTVSIVIGGTAGIISAQKTSGGISVKLSLPSELGEKVLCTALYDSLGRLADLVSLKVSGDMLTDGEITVPCSTSGAVSAKIMLLDGLKTIQPLCEAFSADF